MRQFGLSKTEGLSKILMLFILYPFFNWLFVVGVFGGVGLPLWGGESRRFDHFLLRLLSLTLHQELLQLGREATLPHFEVNFVTQL